MNMWPNIIHPFMIQHATVVFLQFNMVHQANPQNLDVKT